MQQIIEPGDVIGLMGRGPISSLIASFTGPISHVGIVSRGGSDYGSIEVTQALSTVKTLSLAETLAHAKYGYCLHGNNVGQDARNIIVGQALMLVGSKYAYGNLFWQMLKQVTGKDKFTEYMDDDHEVICSELVALCYLKAGLDFGVSPRDCTPTDCLHYALRTAGWLTQPL